MTAFGRPFPNPIPTLTGVGRLTTRSAIGIWWGAAIGLGIILIQEIAFLTAHPADAAAAFGMDFEILRSAAATWVRTGEFYPAWQTNGPYVLGVASSVTDGAILYPPTALFLFAPFAAVEAALPLWWLVPAAIIVAVAAVHRPNRWALVAMFACAVWPGSFELAWLGNPVIWISAAMSLGTLLGWPYALVLLKPSLFPFALIGASARRWWVTLIVLGALSVPFGSLWLDWFSSLTNARGPLAGALYSLHNVPLMVIPLLAWAGRDRRRFEDRRVSTLARS